MAATREIRIDIVGDTTKLDYALRKATVDLERFAADKRSILRWRSRRGLAYEIRQLRLAIEEHTRLKAGRPEGSGPLART